MIVVARRSGTSTATAAHDLTERMSPWSLTSDKICYLFVLPLLLHKNDEEESVKEKRERSDREYNPRVLTSIEGQKVSEIVNAVKQVDRSTLVLACSSYVGEKEFFNKCNKLEERPSRGEIPIGLLNSPLLIT